MRRLLQRLAEQNSASCVCDATSCPNGCCDSNKQCHSSVSATCGIAGAACKTCALWQEWQTPLVACFRRHVLRERLLQQRQLRDDRDRQRLWLLWRSMCGLFDGPVNGGTGIAACATRPSCLNGMP